MSKDYVSTLKTTPNKTYKFSHTGPNTWRQIYLQISSEVLEDQDKFFHERSSTITPILAETGVKIHMGRSYVYRELSIYSIGFKLGEFTWNRKMALYKAKQMRKKKAKMEKELLRKANQEKRQKR